MAPSTTTLEPMEACFLYRHKRVFKDILSPISPAVSASSLCLLKQSPSAEASTPSSTCSLVQSPIEHPMPQDSGRACEVDQSYLSHDQAPPDEDGFHEEGLPGCSVVTIACAQASTLARSPPPFLHFSHLTASIGSSLGLQTEQTHLKPTRTIRLEANSRNQTLLLLHLPRRPVYPFPPPSTNCVSQKPPPQ
jgi:hypothetical protein